MHQTDDSLRQFRRADHSPTLPTFLDWVPGGGGGGGQGGGGDGGGGGVIMRIKTIRC